MAYTESFSDPSLGLTVISVNGLVKTRDLFKSIDFYFKGNRSNLVLFDFSDAVLTGIHSQPLKKKRLSKGRYSRKSDRKAFVFPNIPEQELRPILKEYCQIEETGSHLNVFQSLIEANRWLLQAKDDHREGSLNPGDSSRALA